MRPYCTALRGKDPVPSKICLNNTLLEGGYSFSYLEYSSSFTHDTDIPRKITRFTKTLGTTISVMKPSLVQKCTTIKIHETLAWPIMAYGCQAWTIRKNDETKVVHKVYSRLYKMGPQTKWGNNGRTPDRMCVTKHRQT